MDIKPTSWANLCYVHLEQGKTIVKLLPIAMFWLLGLIWGSSFIYMKMASHLISPLQIVMIRVLSGLIPIAIYAIVKGELEFRHMRHAVHFVVMATVGTVGYYYGFVKASSLLLSGVAGALSGLTPILSFILAALLIGDERFSFYTAIGIVIGFMGVLTIACPICGDVSTMSHVGILYSFVGSFCVGASFVYAKKFVLPLGLPVNAVITYQLALASLLLFFIIDGDGISAILTDPFVAACLILGLGVLGTGLAFIIYYYIIAHLGAVSASTVAFIPPVVAILIGVFLAGETIEAWEYLGAALILAGLLMVNMKQVRNL